MEDAILREISTFTADVRTLMKSPNECDPSNEAVKAKDGLKEAAGSMGKEG